MPEYGSRLRHHRHAVLAGLVDTELLKRKSARRPQSAGVPAEFSTSRLRARRRWTAVPPETLPGRVAPGVSGRRICHRRAIIHGCTFHQNLGGPDPGGACRRALPGSPDGVSMKTSWRAAPAGPRLGSRTTFIRHPTEAIAYATPARSIRWTAPSTLLSSLFGHRAHRVAGVTCA